MCVTARVHPNSKKKINIQWTNCKIGDIKSPSVTALLK